MAGDAGPYRPPVMGPQHPRVKELRRRLGRRSPRSPFVLLEGPRTVGEALDEGFEVETVLVPESGVELGSVSAVWSRLTPAVERLVVRDHVFERLAPTVTPQPMLALVVRPSGRLPESLGPDDIVLVLVDVADPGNTGTILRLADAMAARCVVVVGGADPWGDKSVRASAGSVLRVPVVAVDDAMAAVTELRDAGARVLATDVRAGLPHDSGVLDPPVAILLGSEAHGLRPELFDEADATAHIELPGRAESLNVAMAATLLAFEARRGSN